LGSCLPQPLSTFGRHSRFTSALNLRVIVLSTRRAELDAHCRGRRTAGTGTAKCGAQDVAIHPDAKTDSSFRRRMVSRQRRLPDATAADILPFSGPSMSTRECVAALRACRAGHARPAASLHSTGPMAPHSGITASPSEGSYWPRAIERRDAGSSERFETAYTRSSTRRSVLPHRARMSSVPISTGYSTFIEATRFNVAIFGPKVFTPTVIYQAKPAGTPRHRRCFRSVGVAGCTRMSWTASSVYTVTAGRGQRSSVGVGRTVTQAPAAIASGYTTDTSHRRSATRPQQCSSDIEIWARSVSH